MKSTEQLQSAVDEIRAVCARHGIVLIGTCKSEGIYSEILVAENTLASIGWIDPTPQLDNLVRAEHPGAGWCGGIGKIT